MDSEDELEDRESQLPNALKRKRTPTSSEFDAPRTRLPLTINPFSYPPSLLSQFPLAGLTDQDEDPSASIRDFPHRGLEFKPVATAASEPDTEEEEEEEESKPGKKGAEADESVGHLHVLIQAIHQFLDHGEINKAARAYGVILQLRPDGAPVDVRKHHLWAIGAEILMRNGEEPSAGAAKRWGSAANMAKLKAYYETLIQQHPYDPRRPNSVSALDFQLAQLSCEMYNVYAEQQDASMRLEEEMSEGSMEVSYDAEADGATGGQDARAEERGDRLRAKALKSMQEIAERLDSLMAEPPYSKSHDYLRLRAMASLYIADLVVPRTSNLDTGANDPERQRQREREKARGCLQKIMDNRGELDHFTQKIFRECGGQDERDKKRMHSSLPIRKG
ncbi:hypothetical protein B0I35DRAFT_415971 [Stachybotrys elegans]|uniref:Uncharacterized protein n=1 Tax=Stachybotrys elegans TaxID=80388 RepID=A0A8K0WWX7_9HYPO|nr:hypothetical protein B0I35DRAFT_415971 [Stachybotrys elegans]